MGEEAKKLDDALRAEFPDVPWQRIIAMRNYLAHDYRGVDPERTFDVVQNQLTPLKETLIRMLERVSFDRIQMEEALNSYHYRHLTYLKDKLND
ncbi:hypothetical protein GCM10023189_08020 [Nibrella saemangeumensis]|uniref:DUF86 domain-containing protein n=1 Tax=Nibrella saemangeumensis TaxID=1084526 RepID=A0ABP8MHC8_9BACT